MITLHKVYIEIDSRGNSARLEYGDVIINAVPIGEIRTPEGFYDRDVIFELFSGNDINVPQGTEICDEQRDFDGDVMQLARLSKPKRPLAHQAWYKIFKKQRV